MSSVHMNHRQSFRQTRGFTLVELAIVLVIVGLLIGGMMLTLSGQLDASNLKETHRRLAQAQEALLGFAAANGRLPCPAVPASSGAGSGAESPANTGLCSNPLDGFLPATTLGLGPTDSQGYLLDAWSNRIRYAVYSGTISTQSNPFTTAGKMKSLGIETLSLSSSGPPPVSRQLLFICAAGAGTTATDCGTATQLTDNAIAVIFSSGKNGGLAASGDEAKNTDGDPVFVSKIAADFDDIVTWLSPNILYNRLIAAGRLP